MALRCQSASKNVKYFSHKLWLTQHIFHQIRLHIFKRQAESAAVVSFLDLHSKFQVGSSRYLVSTLLSISTILNRGFAPVTQKKSKYNKGTDLQFGLNMCDTTLQCEQNEDQKRKSDSSHNKKEKRISVSFAESFNIPDGRDCKSPLSKKYIFTFSYTSKDYSQAQAMFDDPQKPLLLMQFDLSLFPFNKERVHDLHWEEVVAAVFHCQSGASKHCQTLLSHNKYLLLQWQEPRRSAVQAAGEPGPRGVPPRPLPRHPARLPRRGRWR